MKNSERAKQYMTKRVSNSSLSSSVSDDSTSNSSRARSYMASKKMGFDTIADDEKNTRSLITSALNGWQDSDTLSNTYNEVSNMRRRLSAYKKYGNSSDSKALDNTLSYYDQVLSSWDDLSKTYGNYKNADAYNSAVKTSELTEKYKGKSYDEIQNATKSATDEDEINFLKNYTDYSSSEDFAKAIANTTDKTLAKKLKASSENYEKENAWSNYSDLMNNSDFEEKASNKTFEKQLDFMMASSNGNYAWETTYSNMNDDEKAVANYIAETQGSEAAKEYVKNVGYSVDKRAYEELSAKNKEKAESNGLIGNTIDTLKNLVNGAISMPAVAAETLINATGYGDEFGFNEYNGASAYSNLAQESNSYIANQINNPLAKWGYNALTSGVASRIGQVAFGTPYTVMMGTSAYASAYKDAIERGLDESSARKTALAQGINEALFEELSFDKFKALQSAGTDSIKTLAKNIAKQFVVEGSEEVNTDIANSLADQLINGGMSEISQNYNDKISRGYSKEDALAESTKDYASQLADSFIVGGLAGGMSSGVASAMDYVNNADLGSRVDSDSLRSALASSDNLQELSNVYANIDQDGNYKNSVSRFIGETDRNAKTGKLVKDAYYQTDADKETQAKEYLLSQGYTDKMANKALSDIRGRKDSELSRNALDSMSKDKEFTNTINTENQAQNNILASIKTKDEVQADKETKKTMSSMNIREDADIQNISNVTKDSKNNIVLTINGEQKSASTVALNPSQAQIVAESTSYNEEGRQAYVEGYTGQNVDLYSTEFGMAYQYGYSGYAEETLNSIKSLPQSLTYKAYMAGRNALIEERRIQKQTTDKVFEETVKTLKPGTFDDSSLGENGYTKLKRSEQDLYRVAQVFSNLGMNIKVFKDVTDTSKNGSYKKDTDTVYINLAARYSRGFTSNRAYVMSTMSHEFTHWSESHNVEGYKELQNVLKTAYGEENWANLIQKEKSRTKGLSDQDAESEVVARAMEDMLNKKENLEHIVGTMTENEAKSFKESLKKFFDYISNFFDRVMKGFKSNSEAARLLAETKEAYEEAEKAWLDMLEEGLKRYQTNSGIETLDKLHNSTEGATDENGNKLFNYKAMEHDMPEYRKLMTNYGNMSESEVDELFNMVDRIMEKVKDNLEILDYDYDLDIDDRAFNPVKANSDPLYKYSVDFSTLCRKRILQQMVQVQLQEALDRPITREESVAIRNELVKIQNEGREIEVACALCYVESARMKSPVQIQKFLDNRREVIKEYFANKGGTDIKQAIADAEIKAREMLAKKYAKEIADGIYKDPTSYTLTKTGKKTYASLKSLPKKQMADVIRSAKKEVAKAYEPTEEEIELLDIADTMTTSDFTSPEGLAKLAKDEKLFPLFDAYTSYVRNATKAKGLEGDTWWRFGDSEKVTDTLVDQMNNENGLRSQSWSDFQVIHLLDYIAATIELSSRNAKMQVYTKVPDYVRLMGNTNQMINLSLIPTAKFKGSLVYDSTEGMPFETALELREKYPSTVGTICIGVDDRQISLLLESSDIDYVIPYHHSGMSGVVRKAMNIPTWKSYQDSQNEKKLKRNEAQTIAKKYGVNLLSEKDANWHKSVKFSDWFNYSEAQAIAEEYNNKKNLTEEEQTMKDRYGVMFGGYVAMQKMADKYIKTCVERGYAPKFSDEKANFTQESNYWKLLIDRKMINNKTGDIIEQKTIQPVFNEDDIMDILNDEIEKYGKIKEDMNYAQRTVVSKFLNGEMTDEVNRINKITRVVTKAVDNVAVPSIVESGKELNSEKVGNGYDGYSMSVNARRAYVNGEMPLSKWSKSAILESIADINPNIDCSGLNLETLKANFLTSTGWHHTSAMYNKTNFYAIDENYVKKLSQKDIDNITPVRAEKQVRNKNLDETVDDAYFKAQALVSAGIYKTENGAIGRILKGEMENAYNEAVEIIKRRDSAKVGQWAKLPENHYRHKYVELYHNNIDEYIKQMYANNKISRNSKMFKILSDYFGKSSVLNSEKVDRNLTETEKKAIDVFGVTDDFEEAGYILSNGQMLRFADENKKRERDYDHRAIAMAYGKNVDLEKNHGFDMEHTPLMNQFVEDGAIRIDSGNLDLDMDMGLQLSSNIPLTLKQEDQIRKLVEWKNDREINYNPEDAEDGFSLFSGTLKLFIEFGGGGEFAIGGVTQKDLDAWGVKSLVYEGNNISADRVINDIRNYYDTGMVREQSDIAKFHTMYSSKVDNEVTELLGKTKELEEENRLLKDDIIRLSRKLRYERIVTNGEMLDPSQVEMVARYLIKKTGSDVDAFDLTNDLTNLYSYILTNKADDWDEIMGRAYDAASTLVVAPAKTNGEDAEIIMDEYQTQEKIRQLAIEIYNKFWSVNTIKTLADEYTEEINKINAEHRKTIDELRKKYSEPMTKEQYRKTINKLREQRNEQMVKAKEYIKNKDAERKDRAEKADRIRKITNTTMLLKNWMVTGDGKKAVPQPLRKPVITLINSIDFSSKQLLGLNGMKYTPTKNDIAISEALKGIRQMAKEIDTEEGIRKYGYLDLPPQFIDEVDSIYNTVDAIERRTKDTSFVLNEMSLEDLNSLNDMLKVLQKSISTMNKMIASKEAHSVDAVAQNFMAYAKERGDYNKGNALKKFANWFVYGETTPVYAFDRFGDSGKTIFKSFMEGNDKYARLVRGIENFSNEAYTKDEINEWEKEIHTFNVHNISDGNFEVTMTTPQLMSLYCLNKREQAIRHFNGGGIRVADYENSKKRTVSQSLPFQADQSAINNMLNELTPRQIEVAEKLQEYMASTCAEWGNEITMKRFGILGFTEKNYYPINVNSDTLQKGRPDLKKTIYALLNMSFTKKLNEDAKNSVMLNDIFDVFADHTSSMALYNSLALPTLDCIKWLNYHEKVTDASGNIEGFAEEGVAKSINASYGEQAEEYIEKFLQDINGNNDRGRMDFFASLTRGYKSAAVGASLQTALLQPLSYIRAMTMIDNKYLVAGFQGNPKNLMEEVGQKSGIAIWKNLGFFETDVSKNVSSLIRHDDTLKDKIIELSLKPAELGDAITWGFLWNACKKEISDKRKDLAYGSDEYFDAVNERFTDVVFHTQVVDSVFTRSNFMRGKDTYTKMLTAFMSEPTVTLNVLYSAADKFYLDQKKVGFSDAFKKNGKTIMRVTGAWMLSAMAESILRTIIGKMRDKEDDENFAKEILEEFLEQINVFTYMPYVKDIIEIAQGYDPTRMDEEAIASVFNSLKAIKKDVTEGNVTYKTVKKALKAGSQVSGLPISNAWREVETIWNNTVGNMYPDLRL